MEVNSAMLDTHAHRNIYCPALRHESLTKNGLQRKCRTTSQGNIQRKHSREKKKKLNLTSVTAQVSH